MIWIEISLSLGTWALVGVTLWIAWKQTVILRRQSEAQQTDLKVRLQLTFIDRFDKQAMMEHRKRLAQHLLSSSPHEEIPERVMDFFEDLGLFIRREYLDEELIWSTFGFYAVRWWAASKTYILKERRKKSDDTLFTDFEDLVQMCLKRDANEGLAEPTPTEIHEFLQDECKL
jgi:hypothetical protein